METYLARFLLIRHGTTDWVDAQILHGITDVQLNALGRAQAEDTAQALAGTAVNNIYASSLSRCMETAKVIGNAAGVDPLPMDALIEIDFGWLEGKKIRDHDRGEYSKLIEFFDHQVFNLVRVLSGEPKKKFSKRVLGAWEQIVSENPQGTAIVVGHSGVFNTILMHLFGNRYLNGNSYHHLNPCSITEIRLKGGPAELARLNDRSHLLEENR